LSPHHVFLIDNTVAEEIALPQFRYVPPNPVIKITVYRPLIISCLFLQFLNTVLPYICHPKTKKGTNKTKIIFREEKLIKVIKEKSTSLRVNATIYIFLNYLKDIRSF